MPVNAGELYIVTYPAAVLRRKAAPVGGVTPEVREVAARMIDLMHRAEGVGLAAPQVGLSWRLFVAHVPENEERSTASSPPSATRVPVVFVNPVITALAGPSVGYDEGCLSIPEITGEVLRPEVATVRATDLAGQEFTFRASGLLARCLQHEIDHLDGVLILDRMSQTARLRNRAAIRDLERSGAAGGGR
ncbi:MAG: peptide deformylase [Phycisphaerales bacterium]|nr:peptide deformylase [Phycisphaerales bacterium]